MPPYPADLADELPDDPNERANLLVDFIDTGQMTIANQMLWVSPWEPKIQVIGRCKLDQTVLFYENTPDELVIRCNGDPVHRYSVGHPV